MKATYQDKLLEDQAMGLLFLTTLNQDLKINNAYSTFALLKKLVIFAHRTSVFLKQTSVIFEILFISP